MTFSVVRIDDANDPRLAAYRSIRERDLTGRQGRFIAEGRVVIEVMLDAGRFTPDSFMILESRLPGMSTVLERVSESTPVYAVSPDVMDTVAGFPMHRGILAVGRKRDAETASEVIASLPSPSTVVVAVGISNHDNVGSIFRNAAAFGADAVLLDKGSCDPLYRKAIRVSAGHALRVPFAHGGSAEGLVELLAAAGYSVLALSPRGTKEIAEVEATRRMALLLGTEGNGLPEDLLAKLATARIDMAANVDSLNVAVTSAIALREIRRAHQVSKDLLDDG